MSSPSIPPPATEPDDGYNPTWEPETFPDTISGVVEDRVTLRFSNPRDPDRPTFEKLTVQASDGELTDVLCGSARLARLVVKHDPQPGDAVSITAFGDDEKGWPRFGLNVDKRSEITKQAEELLGDEEVAS